jgi:hypothetical protein
MALKKVYVAGKFRGSTAWDVESNIRKAEEHGLELAKKGIFPVIPHTMTRFFDKAHGIPDSLWLEGDLDLLRMCDGLSLVPDNWYGSTGTDGEIKHALRNGIWIFVPEHRLTDFVRVYGNHMKLALQSSLDMFSTAEVW